MYDATAFIIIYHYFCDGSESKYRKILLLYVHLCSTNWIKCQNITDLLKLNCKDINLRDTPSMFKHASFFSKFWEAGSYLQGQPHSFIGSSSSKSSPQAYIPCFLCQPSDISYINVLNILALQDTHLFSTWPTRHNLQYVSSLHWYFPLSHLNFSTCDILCPMQLPPLLMPWSSPDPVQATQYQLLLKATYSPTNPRRMKELPNVSHLSWPGLEFIKLDWHINYKGKEIFNFYVSQVFIKKLFFSMVIWSKKSVCMNR